MNIPQGIFSPLPTFFSVWGNPKLDTRTFQFWQAGDGVVLDRSAFDEWLIGAAADAGVTVLRGCSVRSIHCEGDHYSVSAMTAEGLIVFPAGFVVEATGRVARSLMQPGAARFFTDALVCVSLELPSSVQGEPLAGVETCASGWWYVVRLPDDRRLIALFTDADLVASSERRTDWFQNLLETTSYIQSIASSIPCGATLRVWDARTSARKVLWRGRSIAIGDSAWCIDPLSGSGILRAVTAGFESAGAISRAIRSGDIGTLRSLAVGEAQAFRHSLGIQRGYYASELRWADEVFWGRRFAAWQSE